MTMAIFEPRADGREDVPARQRPRAEPERAGTTPVALLAPAARDPRGLSARDVIALQRSAGNAAVARLLTAATPRANRTGLPDRLKAGVEHLSGLAMDDVQVHYNSAKPAEVQALAFAQGSNIHLAPGQVQHLPHEAWHVVQQAQGRVTPTARLHDGVAINDDSGLEREADVMGARALSSGEALSAGLLQPRHAPCPSAAQSLAQRIVQRVASAFPAIAEINWRCQFHTTDFLGRVTLIPIASSAGGERYKSSELWVQEVKISNDRPPTKFGAGGQRSHTVAWSLLRAAIQGLGGQTLENMISMLAALYGKLEKPTSSREAAEAAAALDVSIKAGIAVISDPGKLEDFAFWQLAASELVGKYVHAYQLSDEATYADGQAVGHGEPRNIATLRAADDQAKGGMDLTTQLPDIRAAASGMLDLNMRLGAAVIGDIRQHWIDDLHLAFPHLMAKHHADILRDLPPVTPLDKIRTKPSGKRYRFGVQPVMALPAAGQSTFVSNVVLTPRAGGTARNVDLEVTEEAKTTKLPQLSLLHYKIDELDIAQLDVSDDRPKTRFGILQRSHTVAWTLVRRHLMHFKGKSGAALANFISNELLQLKGDIDTPEKNKKIGFNAPKEAKDKRIILAAATAQPEGYPLLQWQQLLSELVETYVTLYQLSRSATYSKEECPKGHGESQAIATLQAAEVRLADTKPEDRSDLFEADKEAILEAAVKLVDASAATSTLAPRTWNDAIEHWLRLIGDQYPIITALPQFADDVQDTVRVMEPKDELLAGYATPADDRDKALINLYENAKLEVRSVQDTFGIDLYSCIRIALMDFSPPDEIKVGQRGQRHKIPPRRLS